MMRETRRTKLGQVSKRTGPLCRPMRTTTLRTALCLLGLLAQPEAANAAYGSGSPGGGRRKPPAGSSSVPAAAENAPLSLEGAGLNPADELQVTYATEGRCIEEWFARECADATALGFDTETRPSYQKGQVYPTATLQLATADAILVVHLLHLDAMPAVLVDALSSEATLKIGVGVDDDAIDLWLHHGLEVYGRLDLTHAAVAKETASKEKSLGGLCEEMLGVKLEKRRALQLTNWAKRGLTQAEVRYAALDAWAGRAIHDAILTRRQAERSRSELIGPSERSCAELYAWRRVRQKAKLAFSELDYELSQAGSLPHATEGQRQADEVRKVLNKARRDVRKMFAVDASVAADFRGGKAAPAPAANEGSSAESVSRPVAKPVAKASARPSQEATPTREVRLEAARERDRAEEEAREAARVEREEAKAERKRLRKLEAEGGEEGL